MAENRSSLEKETVQYANAAACRTCMFRPSIFRGRIFDDANSKHCAIYVEPGKKPDVVLLDGAACENYHPADNKPQATILGAAVGDALGVPVEFKKRGSFHVEDMIGHGTYDQPAGTWSDDTSMILATADALRINDVNLQGMARRFIAWRDGVAYTPHGETFDIGNATNRAIDKLKKGMEPTKAGGTGEYDNGNGSLMRISPLVFFLYGKPPKERFEITRQVSSLTHAHSISVMACFIYIEMLNLLLKGRSKKAAYVELKQAFEYYKKFLGEDAPGRFDRILKGDITLLPEKEIKSSGYVVDTLEASFWSFLTAKSYREAVLLAVNLGEDTDTTGAVTGAMAGLYYGLKDIPREWLDKLAKREMIEEIAIKMPRWDLLPGV